MLVRGVTEPPSRYAAAARFATRSRDFSYLTAASASISASRVVRSSAACSWACAAVSRTRTSSRRAVALVTTVLRRPTSALSVEIRPARSTGSRGAAGRATAAVARAPATPPLATGATPATTSTSTARVRTRLPTEQVIDMKAVDLHTDHQNDRRTIGTQSGINSRAARDRVEIGREGSRTRGGRADASDCSPARQRHPVSRKPGRQGGVPSVHLLLAASRDVARRAHLRLHRPRRAHVGDLVHEGAPFASLPAVDGPA